MSPEMPPIPAGSGKHPVALVVITANQLAESGAFYSKLFGWQAQKLSAELTACVTPGGPMVALRANVPDGSPGLIPYVSVPDVDAMLAGVVAAGGAVERAPWSVPMMGKLARFKDPSGTVYGLTDAVAPGGAPHIPAPFGASPKPPAGAICSLEMHATGGALESFFGGLFGWSTLPTMPQYTMFDAGASTLTPGNPSSPAARRRAFE